MKPLEEMGRFATVVIDPPWNMGTGRTADEMWRDRQKAVKGLKGKVKGYSAPPFETMTIPEIAALPVPACLEPDARVFLWTTQRYLRDAFGIIDAWGLLYACTMVWHKNFGPQPIGRPQYNSEFILLADKGKPMVVDARSFFAVNLWPNPRSHSTKPEGFYDLLRRVTPAPRLDIFGRRRIAGFHSWGNEAPEGEPAPDHYQQVML